MKAKSILRILFRYVHAEGSGLNLSQLKHTYNAQKLGGFFTILKYVTIIIACNQLFKIKKKSSFKHCDYYVDQGSRLN